MSLTVEQCSIGFVLGHVNLLTSHWREVGKNQDLFVLSPDRESYDDMEAAGMLLCLVAKEAGEVVGYAVSILHKHLHYSRVTVASNDILFVDKKHRGRAGLKLIAETERLAKERGAVSMGWHAKEGTPLDLLLQRKSYGVQDIIYTRRL